MICLQRINYVRENRTIPRASFPFDGLSVYARVLARGTVVRFMHVTFSGTNTGETKPGKEFFGTLKTN